MQSDKVLVRAGKISDVLTAAIEAQRRIVGFLSVEVPRFVLAVRELIDELRTDEKGE